jgi:hypothetical protein
MPLQRFTTHEGKVRRGIRMGVEEGHRLARVLQAGAAGVVSSLPRP